AGQTDEAIRTFGSALERVRSGEQTLIPTADLEPAPDVPALEELSEADPAQALEAVALVKLNGGLATSMGLHQPKSLVEAREGRTFLEIIIGQTMALRRRHGVRLPLVLMNSQATREATARALDEHPEIATEGVPLDFLQSMVPKLDPDTLEPVSWPDDQSLEWNPPGHGDVYAALRGSGMLATLLEQGFRYAMISNADNLGSTVDPRIAAHMDADGIPFLMEVVQGTEADRKGGHIARRRQDGQLVLRETAQTPEDDQESFRDYRRWRYYNTNSLWVDLEALEDTLSDGNGLELPVIINRKTVDPRDSSSPPVLQLESAMGAAIARFADASLLLVPRTRFAPVKTTDDLLVLRSDVYTLDEDCRVLPRPERARDLPYVELDGHYYKLLDEFERRLPEGPPSLLEAQRLVVHGDVTFGRGVIVRGSVELNVEGPERLADETVLSG
ncbi:MAG TPA: UTP--glucose-1-phosphate uridylyltransferase, partial [Solirubrobacteraceae bacterium]|nr:UTP--glucose-1-phosphate uridylyltransferase [Solirubrobacteraceae bacterium]